MVDVDPTDMLEPSPLEEVLGGALIWPGCHSFVRCSGCGL